VADVLDALSSDRPYRKKMSYEEVKEEIEKQISERAAYITGRED